MKIIYLYPIRDLWTERTRQGGILVPSFYSPIGTGTEQPYRFTLEASILSYAYWHWCKKKVAMLPDSR